MARTTNLNDLQLILLSTASQREDGSVLPFTVLAIEGDTVQVDFNPPLAGQVLNFDVKVVSVRDASEEELAHGHVHGEGGHHH